MAELLLRLFQSDFFSPALGVSYLRFYADSIGITWHLIHLLRTRYSALEVAFYWPQLCHLLLSTPHSESLALETYILDIAAADPHTALITSWIFQAALRDLAAQPTTPQFRLCQRILNHCHHILFHTPDLDHFLLAAQAAQSLQLAQLNLAAQNQLEREQHNRLLQQLGASSSESDVALSLPLTAAPSGSASPASPSSSSAADASHRLQQQQQQQQQQQRSASLPPSPPINDNNEDHHHKRAFYLRPATSAFLSQQLPSSLLPALLRRSARPKVLPSNALTTLVGAGAILAASPGQPLLARETAMVAVLQGMKAHDRNQAPRRLTDQGEEVFDENEEIDPNLGPDGRLPLFGIQRPVPPRQPSSSATSPQPPPTPLAAAAVSVAPRLVRHHNAPASASASSIFLPRHQQGSIANRNAPINISQLPKAYLSSLLRTHYFRAQTRILQHLQDISSRLLLHPKADRLAALRSELTSLNHTLPSEVCLPLWCECGPDASTTSAIARAELNASAAMAAAQGDLLVPLASHAAAPPNTFLSEPIISPSSKNTIRHHRIVRISPTEAVVLNSADRAPYLLHVEVLRNDLDFDPDRRGNRALCERLVRGEQVGRARRERGREESGGGGGSSTDGTAVPMSPLGGQDGPSRSNSSGGGGGTRAGRLSASASGAGSPPRLPSGSAQTARSRQTSSSVSYDSYDSSSGRTGSGSGSGSGSAAAEKALPRIPGPLVSSFATSSLQTPDASLSDARAGSPIAGSSTNPASGINPMSEPGPGPSAARMAEPEGALETMFADLAMGDVGARGNEEALAAAAASLASSSSVSLEGALGAADGSMTPNTMAIAAVAAAVAEEDGVNVGEGEGAEEGNKPKKSMGAEDLATVMRAVNKDDPSAAIFRESWSSKKARIRASSPYGHLPEWDVFSMIVKTGADLRQEQLAVQLIHEFGRIWNGSGSRCWVRYFRILVTGEESGLMETITDSVSVHSIKKEAYSRRLVGGDSPAPGVGAGTGTSAGAGAGSGSELAGGQQVESSGSGSGTGAAGGSAQPQASAPASQTQGRVQTYSLFEHFQETFGEPDSAEYREAQTNFIESLAGYSIISYLLQIKDRHNGNILLDHQGHIIHIDFGFMLGISPGGVGFEAAPFKFPQEYIDILGGMGSEAYERFKALMRSGFRDVRKDAERIIMIVELMQKDSKLPCFALNEHCASQLRDRFQLGMSQTQCDEFVDRLVLTSAGSVYTRLYDRYQSFTQGIL
ncbi:unnamed protein product [Tilletia controversa]|nr:hypothetical protein CF335_g6564 [Tilletia laevis]KAE8249348.1 hypothetical protein A4X03_0g6624 [Tilletia caries]CAD6935782.1 unnamed protein product [Tilletia controversa]CAD6885055.1 unnamed protein product [Tilletia caries]CAD6908599.1 unnamed protein product [Tilletia caries]